jgi:ABC-2 type transport system permease protein
MKWFSLAKPSVLQSQLSVLFRKEIAQFFREPSQWIHLGIVAILTLTFLVSIANIDLKQNMPFLQTVSYMVVLLFNAFLVASIALRFIYPSISIEGPEFWSVLSAPIKRNNILLIKFALWFIPVVILSELLVIFSHISLIAYPSLVIVASLLMLGTGYALVGMNLGAGGYFSDYKERNPIRVASSQSATVTFLMSILFLIILVSLTFVPFNGYFSLILKGIPFSETYLWAATGIFLAISVGIGTSGIIIAMKSLRNDY